MAPAADGGNDNRKRRVEQRAWQRMLSGRRLNLLNPSPLDIEIEDIAHGLARVARWNGQTHGPYALSVAQHSVMVERLFLDEWRGVVEVRWRMAALLHDAAEYVIGDPITPFKAALGGDYRTIEEGLQRAVYLRFGLPPVPPAPVAAAIKRADKTAAFSEAVALAGFTETEARRVLGYRRRVQVKDICPSPPDEAKNVFLARFSALQTVMETCTAIG